MEIVLNKVAKAGGGAQKIDDNEELVRKALVDVWIEVLEKYAEPGRIIPGVDEVRKELLEVGVEAAVEALCAEHWFLWPWMVENEVEEAVGEELKRFELEEFVEDVKRAQSDPGVLSELREKVHKYVLEGL
jgi:hypothetical protein